MKKPTKKQILSADYTDIGFDRGVQQAHDNESKAVRLRDISPVNFAWRTNDALDTYSTGQASGYDAQLRKNAEIYQDHGDKRGEGTGSVGNFSLEDQLAMVHNLAEHLTQLEGFLGVIRGGYHQNIESSASLGLGSEYVDGLRQREARLNQTMDEVQRKIQKHRQILEQEHRREIENLIQSANEW